MYSAYLFLWYIYIYSIATHTQIYIYIYIMYCSRMQDSLNFKVMRGLLGASFCHCHHIVYHHHSSPVSPLLIFPTCPQEQWNHWLQQGTSEATLRHQRFRPLHHAFRVIATGEPPTEERNWLEDELLTLFHFTEVEVLGCFWVLLIFCFFCHDMVIMFGNMMKNHLGFFGFPRKK